MVSLYSLKFPSPGAIKPITDSVPYSSSPEKEILMYLSEEKRAEIRKCIEKHQYNQGINPEQNNRNHDKGFHDTEGGRKVSQILFDARDGKEVFTPF